MGASLALNDVPSQALSAHVKVLRNPGTPLTLDEARESYRQGRFQALMAGQGTNFGITRDEVWLQLDFSTSRIPSRWLLEVAHPSLDVLDFYLAGPDGDFQQQHTGDLVAFNQRPVAHRNLIVEWELASHAEYRLFVRARSQGTLSIPLKLWQPDAIWSHDQGTYTLLSLYYGLLLGMMLYNLFLFLALREPLYLAYVAFVGLLGIGQAGLAGFTGQFIWPDNALLTHLSPTGGVSAAGIFGCIFVQRFLGQTPRSLRLQWLMPALGVVFVFIFFCTLFWSYYLAALAVNVAALTFAVIALLLGAVSFYQGRPGARFFVLAWVSLLIGMVILALHNLGFFPSNLLTTNAMLIGSGLEMVLLSLALGDRINAIQRAQDQAQQQALVENRRMVAALRESEQVLESRVLHRTEALEQANAELLLSKAQLEQQANHDDLTGLANRKLLADRLQSAMARSRRLGKPFALLVLDLDKFKLVNDRFGHSAGDELLRQIAGRLRDGLRESDTIARVGGDEFVVLVEQVDDPASLPALHDKLQRLVTTVVDLPDGQQAAVGVSIGQALFPDDAGDSDALFNVADRAMYQAKTDD
ncbi:diguanylate cyclase [Halopseudomonas salegens]|uniref:Diguanylate cyclase (GGDEF) domain-containing protein n=1 Tax=Halopseudomonas salegens TaxID=1434072 RepID=A0A1H2FIR9_9GAMM|nr:diguanylate cyclase [Halopseudomonas salegens]SDU07264.1 diguanylate cyclase (GGDEF) domain-containing protein [Halopseudomonas salegens]